MADKNNYYGFKLTKEQIKDLENRTFIVNGEPCNMLNLWIWANNKEFGEEYPEIQAGAKKVFNALAEELGQAQRLIEDTVKGGFVDYFSKAKELHKRIAEQKNKIDRELEQAKADFEQLIKQSGSDTYLQNQYKMSWLSAQNKHHDEIERLKATLNLEYEKLRTGLNEKLVAFYKPNSNAIDSDTVTLLNSGIKLSEKEINSLVNKFKENPTMIRLISGYCDNNGIRNGVVLGLNNLATSEGKNEMMAFNTLMQEVSKKMFEKGSEYWAKPNRYEQIFDKYICNIANYGLHTEELPQIKASDELADNNKNDESNIPRPEFTAPIH